MPFYCGGQWGICLLTLVVNRRKALLHWWSVEMFNLKLGIARKVPHNIAVNVPPGISGHYNTDLCYWMHVLNSAPNVDGG